MIGITRRVWPWKRQLETGLIPGISEPWDGRDAALPPTQLRLTVICLPKGGLTRTTELHMEISPTSSSVLGKYSKAGWAGCQRELTATQTCWQHNIPAQSCFDHNKIPTSWFLDCRFPWVCHLIGASEDFLTGQPRAAFPSLWSQALIFLQIHWRFSNPLSPISQKQCSSVLEHTAEAQLFQSAHSGPWYRRVHPPLPPSTEPQSSAPQQ